MKTLTFKKISLFVLGHIALLFGVLLTGVALLRFPETASQGISDGIDLCLGTLIPSLYPFMILSSFITQTEFFPEGLKLLDWPADKIFALNGKCIIVIILSLIGGLPLGCKMVCDLYRKSEISLMQGQRMMLFCFCSGPAFTICSVGLYMLGSKQAGLLAFVSMVLSALTIGILSRFFGEENIIIMSTKKECEATPFSVSLVRAVSNGSTAMLNVCAWVILFSCISRLIEIMPFNQSFNFTVNTLLEITNGTRLASGILPLPIITAIISFGGLCGHCQVMPYIISLKLKYKYFLTSRIVGAALSAIYCELLMKIFPVTYEVFSLGTLPDEKNMTASAICSISMLVTSGLFLLGDGAVFRIKRKKDHRNQRWSEV